MYLRPQLARKLKKVYTFRMGSAFYFCFSEFGIQRKLYLLAFIGFKV